MFFDASTLQARRTRIEKALSPLLRTGDVVLVFAGEPMTKPGGLDQTYPFLPHPAYFWATGRRRPGGVFAFSPSEGFVDFTKPFAREEAVWEGARPDPNPGTDVGTLLAYLGQHRFNRVFLLGQPPHSALNLAQNAAEPDRFLIQTTFDIARRAKDAAEIQTIEKLAAISKRGYDRVKSFLKPGVTEKEIQIEFESEIRRAGAHGTPYDTIVGTGTNGAILHAIPTDRVVGPNDMILIDAGAEIFDYCTDITRVYPASGRFSSQQQSLYDLVKNAQARGIEKCRVGTRWPVVHETTARVIADGLKGLGILRGTTDSILESGAISIFYPHGVGHLVGLRVRDTGNLENQTPRKYCGVTLRVDLELQENYLITVEPGCYFIDAYFNDSDARAKFGEFIDWNEAEKWRHLGGVRIEDDVLITKDAPRVLTAIVEK